MTTYKITKQFTNGTLKGLTITETTSVKFQVGKEYKACAGSDYKIVKVEKAA